MQVFRLVSQYLLEIISLAIELSLEAAFSCIVGYNIAFLQNLSAGERKIQ